MDSKQVSLLGEKSRLIFAELGEMAGRLSRLEQEAVEERIGELRVGGTTIPDRIGQHLELTRSLYPSYILAVADEKREILKIATSNLWVDRKNVAVELQNPFLLFLQIANRSKNAYCDPCRDIPRTSAKSVFWPAVEPCLR
jgi:hypothetical protein